MRGMQNRLVLVFALGALASGCAAAQLPDKPVLKDYAVPQKVFELKSGLRVLVQEDHTTSQVVVTSTFAAGSKDDPVGKEGLAHFVEHLVFRSKPDGKTQVWDLLKRTGGLFNAFTAADITQYYTIAHKQELEQLMQLEAWKLLRTIDGVTEEEFATERDVVRNELRLRGQTSVGSKIFDATLHQLFPKSHPLGRTLAGTPESMLATSLQDAHAFVKRHYTPNNCTVVVAGDVNPDQVAKLLGMWPAELLFAPGGPDAPALAPRTRFKDIPVAEPPPPVNTTLQKFRGPVLGPTLLIGWSLPGGLRGNDMKPRFAAQALNVALATGIERKYKDALEGLGAAVLPFVDSTVMLIQASLKPGADPEKVRNRILDAVSNTWAGDEDVRLTQQLLGMAGKWGTATALVRLSGDPVASALGVSEHLAATGAHTFYKDALENLAAVQWTDVTDFAYRYLKRERAVSVFFEPENDEVNTGGAVVASHRYGGDEKPNIAGLGPDEIRAIMQAPGLSKIGKFQLDNGLTVYTVPRKDAHVASVQLSLPGGDATTQPYGMAGLARRISRTQCRDHGELFTVGGDLSEYGGDLSTTFSVDVLSGNLVNGLAVLSDEVSCQEASDEIHLNMKEYFDESEARLQMIRKRQQYRAAERFSELLYPKHPFGKLSGEPKELRKVNFSELQGFVHGHYRPSAATAVVVADAPQTEVETLARKYFARWTSGRSGAGTPPPAPPPPAGRTVILYDRPGATQTTVSLGCRLPDMKPEALAIMDVTEGALTEKLWELRSRWGATYGMYASTQHRPGGAADLIMGGAIETPQTGAGVKAMLALLEKSATDGPDLVTFTNARWELARKFSVRFASPERAADAILSAVSRGWQPRVWDEYPEQLASTTRADVRDLLAPCANHEVVVLVGDAKAVTPQLDAEGVPLTETVPFASDGGVAKR